VETGILKRSFSNNKLKRNTGIDLKSFRFGRTQGLDEGARPGALAKSETNNPNWWDRRLATLRTGVIAWLGGSVSPPPAQGAFEQDSSGGKEEVRLAAAPSTNFRASADGRYDPRRLIDAVERISGPRCCSILNASRVKPAP